VSIMVDEPGVERGRIYRNVMVTQHHCRRRQGTTFSFDGPGDFIGSAIAMIDVFPGARPAYRVLRVRIGPLVVKRHLVGRSAWQLIVLTGEKCSAVGGPRAGEISDTTLGLDKPDDSYAVGTTYGR